MSSSVVDRVGAAVAGGRPREAIELLGSERPPLDPRLASDAAEAWAAVGRERRGAALLLLAARRHPGDRALAAEAARALLRRGRHRQASRVLAASGGAPVLAAVAARLPVPPGAPTDQQDEIDRALGTAAPTADLLALLERAPGSVRLRIAAAARALDEGRGAHARAILREGLKGREDARLELALVAVAVAAGTWDEAAVVLARARSRFPGLARDPALLALLGLITVGAGRSGDAISLLHGGGRAPITTALYALLAPPAAAPKPAAAAAAAAAPAAAPARPMSALMQETLARAGAAASAGRLPVGGYLPGAEGGSVPAAPTTTRPVPPPPAPSPVAPTPAPATAAPTTARPPAGPGGTTNAPPHTAKAWPPPAAANAPPRPTAPTFRRIDAQPEPRPRRGVLAIVVAVALLVVGLPLWRKLTTPEPTPAPNAGHTAFATQLARCGLDVEPWIDVDVAPASLAGAASRVGWRGRPATVPPDGLPLDAALQPEVVVLPLRTGAALETALVVTPALDRVLGLAFTTSSEHPPVSALFGALKFDRAAARRCPQAGTGECVVGTARCEDLAIRVQALCASQTTASLLPRCALDTAVIGPSGLLPPPAPPVTVAPAPSSLSGTDLVVNEP